ncbi:tripartite motif-containing protein 5-like [Molossus nigricans]
MASRVLGNIKEEVTCPICLELLKEPMSLDCGHSFYQDCITANNKELGQEGESHCPVCRLSYQHGNLRPSRHLANIVETLRNVKLNPEEEQKRDLCVRHGERLLLFCKEDEKIICWLCERSQEHRGHHTFLMEEVAQEYKEKLQEDLKRLMSKEQIAEKWREDIREERTSWKDQIENENQCVQDCFKRLREILDNEEQKELQRLKKEDGDVLNDLAQDESKLGKQSQLLKVLILDPEHRLQGSTLEMLQDVNSIMKRSKTFILRRPKTLVKKQRSVFKGPDLTEVLQKFTGLTWMRHYWIHVTLNPPTKKSNVDISAGGKEVRCVLRQNTNCASEKCENEDYGILGSLVITSRKYYWEVDVSEKRAWALGVCVEKCPDFRPGFVRQSNNCQHIYSRCQPKCGYWVIGLENQCEYNAFEDGFNFNPSKVPLKLTVPLHRVGIFLDYNAGTVSFLNVTNHGFLIYKFSSCSFSQKVFPYFNPMTCTGTLKLCSSRPSFPLAHPAK